MGAHTLQSFGKGTNENQDCFVASSNGSKFLAGVFDGHGEKGKRISEFAKSALSKSLFTHKELHNDPRSALADAYRDTQNQIERTHGPDAAESGTTAVACYQHRDRLLVANVGDSRAVLGRCDTARKGGLKAIELTSDQKPSRADEKQRILAAGGKVDQLVFPVWNNAGGVRLMRGGPERVMDSSGFGGLAMSRSLGDLSLRPYVSSLPELFERKLDSKDRFLVLGSDGVWDQMSSQEAVDIASRVSDPSSASREICNQARRRWQSETEGLLSDDITAVVVRLDHDQDSGLSGNAVASNAMPRPVGQASTASNFFRSQSMQGDGRGGDRRGGSLSASAPLQGIGEHREAGGLRMDRMDRSGMDRNCMDRNAMDRNSMDRSWDRPHESDPRGPRQSGPDRMSQTLGGSGRSAPWAARDPGRTLQGGAPWAGQDPGRTLQSNTSEGNRRFGPAPLGHSRSAPTLGPKGDIGRHTVHGSGGFRPRNDLMRPAGR